jgi:hypothetical protein
MPAVPAVVVPAAAVPVSVCVPPARTPDQRESEERSRSDGKSDHRVLLATTMGPAYFAKTRAIVKKRIYSAGAVFGSSAPGVKSVRTATI